MVIAKSIISNSAIRIFLQEVGKFYDKERGFEPFIPKKNQKIELLECFNYMCCYCGIHIDENTFSQDHLIPMNKSDLGLHAWGNVVPCCKECNNVKQQKPWVEFLSNKSTGKIFAARKNIIDSFITAKNYDPNMNIQEYAGNLYEDVGQVAMTLINLRYKQAEAGIKQLLQKK